MEKNSMQLSIIAIGGVLGILLIGVLIFDINIVVLMFFAIVYLSLVSKKIGLGFQDILDGMAQGCQEAFLGLLFFLLIGALIAAWIASGTVPYMVYLGLKIISPKYFLLTSFILCSIVSLILGTSWGTVGTVGVAIVGVAISSEIKIPLEVVVGSIVSGCWFGDKISPVSDSTILTATLTNTNIYRHIQAMCLTTIPSYIITAFLYLIINNKYDSVETLNEDNIFQIQSWLQNNFTLNFWVIIPIIVLAILCIRKTDAVVSLLSAILAAIICAIVVQGMSISSSMDILMNGLNINSSIAEVDSLINRGGINSMLPTFLLGFMAICLGGAIQKTQFLSVLVSGITTKLKSTVMLIFTTMLTCVLSNMAFADNYLSMVLNANLYKKIYKEKNLESCMLSRTIEESSTMASPLIPWTAGAVFIYGILGVPATQYAPYAFLNIINPIFSLIATSLGIFVMREYNNPKLDLEIIRV
jgi:NhaC family Na+:H+ antiporter